MCVCVRARGVCVLVGRHAVTTLILIKVNLTSHGTQPPCPIRTKHDNEDTANNWVRNGDEQSTTLAKDTKCKHDAGSDLDDPPTGHLRQQVAALDKVLHTDKDRLENNAYLRDNSVCSCI